jgi:orotate phosphoribosyltransferase
VVVAVDRQERGQTSRTTLAELRDELSVPVLPIVTIRELAADLHGREVKGRKVLDDRHAAAIDAYLAEHGGEDATV